MNAISRYLPRMAVLATALFCFFFLFGDVEIEVEEIAKNTSLSIPNHDKTAKEIQALYLENEKAKAENRLSDMEEIIRSNSEYNMLSCIVQKSMSTLMTAIMCFLYEEKLFLKKNRDFFMEWSDFRSCRTKNEFNSVQAARKKFHIGRNSTKWSLFMLTRDPVERFISGYVDKCIGKPILLNPCNNCGKNMTCFIIREYERMMEQSKTRKLRRTFEDRHFFPQNWRCDLRREYKKFKFIHYSSDPADKFMKSFYALARHQNVSKNSIKYIQNQLSQERTVHSTVESPAREFLERRLRNSSFLMEYVVRMFYHDFILFDYPFPHGF